MRLPVLRGVIDRRILVNYRIDPERLQALLPAPFRPQLVRGMGIGGICLIRLAKMRPRFFPMPFGFGSENAAHRIAVEWDQDGQVRRGVYIPRRDTSSRLNMLAGGRLFPGQQNHAKFQVQEGEATYQLQLTSDDGQTRVALKCHLSGQLPATSVFRSLQEASEFFAGGSLGYSARLGETTLDGMELNTFSWKMEPLAIEHVESSFFDDVERFPAGTIQIDSAFLMRQLEHEWIGRPALCAGTC